jgi:serine/threonine protein kinase
MEPPPLKKRCMSTNQAKGPRYELGRIISSGMIGIVYLARATEDKSVVCIKRMLGKKMAEKNIFQSVSRELKILNEVQKVEGCIKLYDIITDDDSLSLVMPWYP